MHPELTTEAADALVLSKPAPRVTVDSIRAKICAVEYARADVMTVCFIHLENGYIVQGSSAPASSENYDYEVGKRYAYDDAFRKIWPLEGYLLREKLHLERMKQ